MKPYHIYFEGNAGLLARDYARFPNKVLWKLAEKVREVVAPGKVVHIVDDLGTDLTPTYDGNRLYGMQFRAGDPPGRCHFPWGRCGVFNGEGNSNGEVYLSCVQGIAGRLAEPMRWKVKDNVITEVNGGGEVGKAIREGTFRQDLYYRLKVVTLPLPPLRDRKEDIPELVRYFLQRFRDDINREVGDISPRALEKVMRYHWPGNVRELENAVKRALVIAKGHTLLGEDFLLEGADAGWGRLTIWNWKNGSRS